MKLDLANAFLGAAKRISAWEIYRRSKTDPNSYRVADSSASSRLMLMLDWWDTSKNEQFVPLIMDLANNPPTGWSAWRDGAPMVEYIKGIRADSLWAGFPLRNELADCLETGLLRMLAVGMAFDDLEKVFDAVEEAAQYVSVDIGTSVRDLIKEEFENISRNVADSDSESTLEDHIETLKKLGPRVDIPEQIIGRAISIIRERIGAIAEQAPEAEPPGIEAERDFPDLFADDELRDLFAPLLNEVN